MKASAEQPEAGTAVKTTTIRQVVAATPESAQTPELFDYLQAIKPADWANHTIYAYRTEPQPSIPINKGGEVFLCPDGTTVRIADQEELELALSRYYGGGTYRFIVKRGTQRMTQGNIRIGGPVKGISPIELAQPVNQANGSQPQPQFGESATALVASRAFDALGNADRTAAEIGLRMMDSASAVVQRLSQTPPPNQNGGGDDVMRQFMQVMIARAMQDPFEQFVKFAALMRDMGGNGNGGNGGGVGSELIATVVKAATDRLLNPAPAGPAASPVAEAIHAVTAIAPRAVEGIHEYRLAMEAQRDAIAMQTTRPAQPQSAPQPNAQVLPPAQPNPNPGAQPVSGLSAELIEQRIVEMLKANVTVNDAAADLFHFLQVGQGPGGVIIPQLVSLGEVGLVNLFSTRDILKPMWKMNSQRCIEFIRAFLKYAAEEGNPAPQGTA